MIPGLARLRAPVAAVLALSCASGPRPARDPVRDALAQLDPRGPGGPYDPRTAGVITLLGIELPEPGATIGGHFEGIQFDRQVGNIRMGEGARMHWMLTARDAGDSVLVAAGFRVQRPTLRTSDAERLRGVRFGLTAQVILLRLKTTGNVEPFIIDGTARIEWELFDLAAGAAVFEGSSEASVHGADSLEAAVDAIVALSLSRLLAQADFQRAIAAPRPLLAADLISADFARTLPGADDTIVLAPSSQNMSHETGLVGGVVVLNGTRRFSVSAIVLTRDGLALTQAAAARQHWLWARHFDNHTRGARLVRVAGDVALVELSCVDGCDTVLWTTDTTMRDRDSVLQVGGRAVAGNAAMGIAHSWRRVKVRRERDGVVTWTLRGRPPAVGGEAIARADGIVVGIATRNRIIPIGEALRALNVQRTARQP